MKILRQKTYLFALLIPLALFAGCKGESSPTAPPTSTNPGGGGVTPPSGASVTLTVSNANPFVSGTSTVTATVTQNGQPVANGTAVEFTTDFGTFVETGANTALRTTTNGVATITITSPTAGKSTIQAVVNNVARTTSVTFKIQEVQPCTVTNTCPEPQPTITGVTPAFGSPGGGETVTIAGQNLKGPVKVFFDFGAGTTPKEAFVVSATESQIVVVTPAVDLGTGQTKNATIVVLTQAGTTSEKRVTAPSPFVFQAEVLTPSITTLSPASGPIDGGTRVTIFGDAFQAPVQVFFGSAEAQVITVQFKQLIVMSPTARDTASGGSGAVTGAVDVRVINITSAKSATLANGFRYTPKMQITAFGPGSGTAFGGTRVTIDGIGFNDPVTVSIGGIIAAPIKVTGTQVVAITGRTPVPCTPPTGPVVVTNVDNGDGASGGAFTYTPEIPLITSVVTPTCNNPGCNVQVTVIKPGVGIDGTAIIRFVFGTGATAATVFPTPSTIVDPVGPTTFQMPIPNVDFPTTACTVGGLAGTKKANAKVDLTFTNMTTGCTDVIHNFVIAPTDTSCTLNAPAPVATVNPSSFCPATPAPPGFGSHPNGSTTSQILTVSNTGPAGASDLVVTGALLTGANADQFTVSPTAATIAQGTSAPFTVSFKPTSVGTKDATLTLTTNDPARQQITICLQGIGTP